MMADDIHEIDGLISILNVVNTMKELKVEYEYRKDKIRKVQGIKKALSGVCEQFVNKTKKHFSMAHLPKLFIPDAVFKETKKIHSNRDGMKRSKQKETLKRCKSNFDLVERRGFNKSEPRANMASVSTLGNKETPTHFSSPTNDIQYSKVLKAKNCLKEELDISIIKEKQKKSIESSQIKSRIDNGIRAQNNLRSESPIVSLIDRIKSKQNLRTSESREDAYNLAKQEIPHVTAWPRDALTISSHRSKTRSSPIRRRSKRDILLSETNPILLITPPSRKISPQVSPPRSTLVSQHTSGHISSSQDRRAKQGLDRQTALISPICSPYESDNYVFDRLM